MLVNAILVIVVTAIMFGELAQLGERLLCKQEVNGSNPLFSTTLVCAGVTQLVEYLVANQIVVGSSPITRSILLKYKSLG